MSRVYVFKVSNRYLSSIWRNIQIKESQTLGHLDGMIREAFNYEQNEYYSSEFFRGKAGESPSCGMILPGAPNRVASKLINTLGLEIGNRFDYVFDFNVVHIVELIEILEGNPNDSYPRLSGKNERKSEYCNQCSEEEKKTAAVFTVFDFRADSVDRLCEQCIEIIYDNQTIGKRNE